MTTSRGSDNVIQSRESSKEPETVESDNSEANIAFVSASHMQKEDTEGIRMSPDEAEKYEDSPLDDAYNVIGQF